MNFLGLGPGEILLILVLALIVFGPGKLPEIGSGLGKAIREFRRASDSITQEFTRELSLEARPQESQPAPVAEESRPAPVAAEPQPAPVAEEPHPVATPVAEELSPAAEPIVEEPRQPEPVVESPAVATEPAPPVKRVRRVRAASVEAANGSGEPAVAVKRTRKPKAAAETGNPATEDTAAAGQPQGTEA